MKKKEKWVKPKLIILTRGKPEEAVLADCKGATYSTNISVDNTNCQRQAHCDDNCNLVHSS